MVLPSLRGQTLGTRGKQELVKKQRCSSQEVDRERDWYVTETKEKDFKGRFLVIKVKCCRDVKEGRS